VDAEALASRRAAEKVFTGQGLGALVDVLNKKPAVTNPAECGEHVHNIA
jgi:hypothetical protein